MQSLNFEANRNLTVKVTEDGTSLSQTARWCWGTNKTVTNIVSNGELFAWKLDKLTADALWFYDEDNSYFKLEPKKQIDANSNGVILKLGLLKGPITVLF